MATKDRDQDIKLPPQNVEAEQSVLGGILIDKDALFKIANVISPEDFYRDDHREIYSAMLELFEKRAPIDLVTLTDTLKKNKKLEPAGGATYLSSLASSIVSSAHISKHAEIVAEKAILRRLIKAATQIIEQSYSEKEDIPVILDKSEQVLFAVSQRFTIEQFIPLKDLLGATFDRINELHENKGQLRGVASGFRDLDNLLAGFQKSDLIIIAARPSMGKTSLALNIASHAATKSKVPVGIFSLEMSRDQVVDGLLTMEAGIDSWRLRTGNLREDDFPKINHAMGVLSEAPIFIDDSPLLSVMDIRAKARRLQAEKGLGLVIVDYLQLMESRNRAAYDFNRVQEVSDISRGLKALARELSVPVIAISQLSRAVEARQPKIPQLADLRESGCLAGSTLVFDAASGKRVPIAELAGRKNLTVCALGSDGKLYSQKATRIFPTGRKRAYELILASGKSIRATANHQFLTVNGWRRLDELTPGDFLATPREIRVEPTKSELSDGQIVLLAHLIGDGCYLKNQPLHYTNSDPACLTAVDEAASKEFGTRNRRVKQENWFHLYLSAPYPLARGRRNPIARWLDEELGIFNQRAGEKRLPEQIFALGKEKISLFLRHLFATDGSLTKSAGLWRLFYATKSQRLAKDVQHLLLRFGIHSRIKPNRKGNYQPVYFLTISGAGDQLRFLRDIGIFAAKSQAVERAISELERIVPNPNVDVIPREVWPKIVAGFRTKGWTTREFHSRMDWAYSGTQRYGNGLSRERLGKVATVLKGEELMNLACSDIFWEKIVAINPGAIEKVYDITVPALHNFVADDIVVHNSIEQDADVVIFIYREEYYDPDTEDKGIAQILIKKHRNGPVGELKLYFHPEFRRFTTLEKKRK